MRKPLLTASLCLLLSNSLILQAQTNLNWASAFSPIWSNGNTNGVANNIGGSGINCTASATIVGGGTYMQALGTSGAQTPTVSGATFTVPGTTSRLQVTPNFSTNTGYMNIVMTFTSMATNVTFRIVDIDKNDAFSSTYFDKVTVTGTNGVTTYNPVLTRYDAVTDPNFLVISGNTAYVNTTDGNAGNSSSDASDQRGTVTVSFGSAAVNSITIRYENAAGADANPASQAIAVGSVSFTNLTLPVSLSAFSGHRQSQDVVLNWETQQEENALQYELERSSNNGGNWETIGTVAARGTTSSLSKYTYTDLNPQGTVLFYRLRQVDIDHNFKYSSIIRIAGKDTKTTLLTYPNPFTDQVNITVNSPINQQVSANIYDAGGRMVQSQVKTLYSGNNSFTVTGLDRLTRGAYFAEVKDMEGNLIGRTQLLKN